MRCVLGWPLIYAVPRGVTSASSFWPSDACDHPRRQWARVVGRYIARLLRSREASLQGLLYPETTYRPVPTACLLSALASAPRRNTASEPAASNTVREHALWQGCVMTPFVQLVQLALATVQPIQQFRRAIPFPRRVLAKFLADPVRAVPGTKIASPPFEAGGSTWQVELYPFGGNADASFAGRVGLYLRMVQGAPKTEADVTFSLVLRCLPPEAVAETADFDFAPATQRGLAFRCGMTFCEAAEAGNSIGRCEDWGAHVYQTDLLLRELEAIKTCEAFVDCELNIWARRPSRTGASLTELLDQVQRLPSGTLRVGEVAVSLAARDVAVVSGDGSSEADAADGGPGMYRTLEGGEYRVMRLETPEGSPCFRYDPTRGDRAQQPAVAYLLPTNTKWRDSGSFASNQDGMARLLYQVDDDGASSPKDAAQILRECGDGPVGVPPTYSPDGGTRWPVAVPVEQLPPLASRLGLRALPARLRFALQTRTRTVLLFLLIGASPLWGGFIASQFASACALSLS